MAQVPYQPFNTVQAQGDEPARENIQANPADFGAAGAEAAQKLGGTEEQVGQTLGQQALQYQDLNNQAAAREALGKYTPAMAQAWAQYGTLQGKAASDALPGFLQNLQDIQKQYADGLQSPMARNSFMEASSYLTNRLSLMSSEHAAQQQKAYWVDQAKSNQVNMGTTAALFMNDQQTVDTTVNSVAHSAQQEAELMNKDPDSIKMHVDEAVGQHVERLVKLQAVTNPDLAKATFDRLMSRMDGKSIEETSQFLKPILRSRQGDADLNSLLGGAGGGGRGGGTPGDVIPPSGDKNQPRGLRNNNPLNLSGAGDAGDDGRFGRYSSMESGVAANVRQIVRDYDVHGLTTLTSLIGDTVHGWSPQADPTNPSGSTANYISAVAKTLGISPNDDIGPIVHDPGKMVDLVHAMSLVENSGRAPARDVISRGVQNGLGGTPIAASSSGSGTLAGGLSPNVSQMPDWSALKTQAIAQFGDDPERLSVLMTKLSQTESRMEGATHVLRESLKDNEPGLEKALLDGNPVPIPEDDYLRSFEPIEAQRRLTNLHVAQVAGSILQGVQWGSPAQLDEIQNDLTSGKGIHSDQIRAAVAGLKGSATVTTGQLGEGGVTQTATAYSLERRVADMAKAQIEKRAAMLTADPAGYTANEPSVSAASKSLAATLAKDPNNPDPGVVNGYVNTTLGMQSYLGVPADKQHILSVREAQATTAALSRPDVDQGQQLAALAHQWGDAWPKVYGDLVTLGKMPASAQVLSMIQDPVVRNDFQNMQKMATEKGGIAKLHELAGKSNMHDIDTDIDTNGALLDFARSANIPGIYNNTEGLYNIKDAVKNLAAYYTIRGEATGSAALDKAAKGIIDAKYDFDGYLRTPKGQMAPIESYGESLKSGLTPESLAPVQGRQVAGIEQSPNAAINERVQNEVVKPIQEQSARDSFREIQRTGKWVTNENDSGAFLVAQDKNGVPYRVMGKDGKRIEFSFKDAVNGNLPATGPVPRAEASPTEVPLGMIP